MNITETVEGLERYPVNLRYPRHTRDDIDKLMELPLVTPSGAHIPLSRVADIRFSEGPPMIKTGGCVLALDHRITNGTPLENYRFYVQKAWEIMNRESTT